MCLLKIIFHHNLKLQLRNYMLWGFFFFMLLVVTYFHLRNQSNLSVYSTSGRFTLASFIPYMNAYIFSVLQIIPMIFITTSVLSKEKRINTLDTIYYRPESNMEYVWGTSLGILFIFLIMSIVSLFVAVLIHLFASDAPFCFWYYLFYFLTIVVPAVVFTYGFSLAINHFIGNQLLCITILLIYFIVSIFYITDSQQGLFDPMGITLPSVWSEITGHANLLEYLLQRGCWFLLGLGFVQLSVLKFARLSNNPMQRKTYVIMTLSLIFGGLILGISFLSIYQKKKNFDKCIWIAILSIR